jgi:hypothetical protein
MAGYKCSKCGKEFSSINSLENHQLAPHPKTTNSTVASAGSSAINTAKDIFTSVWGSATGGVNTGSAVGKTIPKNFPGDTTPKNPAVIKDQVKSFNSVNATKANEFLALAKGSGMSQQKIDSIVLAIMTDGDEGLTAQQLFNTYKPKSAPSTQPYSGGMPKYNGSSNIDNRTEEQKAKDLANLGAAYNDAEAKAASGDPSKLRELDAFFQVTRPEEQYSAEYNQLKTVRLISGDGPSLPGDTLQGNGSAVYAVNERGERFHVTQEMATKMRANGTWKEPENLSQAEVDGMKMRFALSDTSQIGAINKPAINGFMLVSGDAATTLGPETLTGNGAAVYAVNDKGERFHVTSAMAQEMRANNTWQQPIELSQASVDKMAFKGSFNSLTDFNNGTVTDRTLDIASPVATQTKPASGIGVQPPSIDPVPPQRGSTEPGGVRSAEFRDVNKNGVDDRDESTGGVRAGFIDEPRKPIASNPATPSTPGVSGAHVRNEQDSGFAYPWSAAKATGTTDVQGTIGKAVEFMNKHEGKNYKYDSIKGTIQAEDGSFISKNDVQSLNNIITKYHKTNFELPESAGAGVVAPQSVNLTYGGVGSPQRPLLGDVTNGAVRIGSAPQDGLYSPTSGGLAGNTPGVKTHPVEGGFNLP